MDEDDFPELPPPVDLDALDELEAFDEPDPDPAPQGLYALSIRHDDEFSPRKQRPPAPIQRLPPRSTAALAAEDNDEPIPADDEPRRRDQAPTPPRGRNIAPSLSPPASMLRAPLSPGSPPPLPPPVDLDNFDEDDLPPIDDYNIDDPIGGGGYGDGIGGMAGDASGNGDEGGAGGAAAAAKKAPKKIRIVPKLDCDRLLGPQGLPLLRKMAGKLKLKGGKGNEIEDLNKMMEMYQIWAHTVFPSLSFDAFIEKTETLCRKAPMKNWMMGLLDEEERRKALARGEVVEDDRDEEHANGDGVGALMEGVVDLGAGSGAGAGKPTYKRARKSKKEIAKDKERECRERAEAREREELPVIPMGVIISDDDDDIDLEQIMNEHVLAMKRAQEV
ncbi:hypothetical protein HK101_008993 [Irineochytrium annulatum]|nr:hypothetical protein HK101_008993 [Irineochytrium annulatum]